jgi:hypothetical protein
VLDPRISYEGLKIDYADDSSLSNHLEESKLNLYNYYDENYATLHTLTPSSPPSTSIQALPMDGSPQKSFTARYRRKEKHSSNELEEYFKLPAEDFDMCNPVQWWVGRQSQFPHLFQLARDILCIPGQYFGKPNSYDSDMITISQVLLLRLKGYSRVGGILFHSDALVSNPTPFASSCLSRSVFTSSVPGPKLPLGIRAVLAVSVMRAARTLTPSLQCH